MSREADRDNLLADSRREDYLNYGIRLYKAAMIGDWEAAAKINVDHPNCFIEKITKQGDTALHIAAISGRVDFISHVVPIMARSQHLDLTNSIGNTALCFAAASGTVASAKVMVEAAADPRIQNNKGLTPLHMAALLGHRDMVNYLWDYTTDDVSDDAELISIFISIINTDLYDVALGVLIVRPDLAIKRDNQTGETPLHVLAMKSHKSYDQNPQGFWNTCFNTFNNERTPRGNKQELVKLLWKRVLQETPEDISQLMVSPWRLLFVAVEVGNVDFVTTLINGYPDLIWKLDEGHRSIFHVAVKYRQEAIFRLIFEIGAIKDLLVTYVDEDDTRDSILHLAALLPSCDRLNCVSGAALQMQREMVWFKAVESIVPPQLAEAKNREGKTAKALFTEQHKELRKDGEEWLRKTAGSCSVVATLIAGVVFGAALKFPESEGIWHWLFAISDSLSLISSTASILMFLSIMTSRYGEDDFLKSLPQKLMIGLTLLFISIATMMVAFTATFHIIFNLGYAYVATSVLSCVPIVLFAMQEFPLLMEVYHSTIDCNCIFMHQHQLFCSNSQID